MLHLPEEGPCLLLLESGVLTAAEGITLHSAQLQQGPRPKSQKPVPSLTRQVAWTSKLQPTSPKRETCGPPLGSRSFLQTAQTTTFNLDCPRMSARVRITMDTGSQMSYITDAVRQQLALTSAGERSISIMHDLWCQSGQRTKLRVCESWWSVSDSQALLCANDLWAIDVPSLDCQKTYSHLTGLELADDPGESRTVQVDILIGCDHYWDLITWRLQRGTAGPVATETKLGWILSGPADISSRSDELHSLVVHTLQISAPTPETQNTGQHNEILLWTEIVRNS